MEASKSKFIVIHCSDTPASMDIGAVEIDQWHKERGWDGIGYHFVIRRSGLVESGRPIDADAIPGWQSAQGAHVLGHNANSIGVCLIGGRARPGDDLFTDEQMNTLWHTVEYLTRVAPFAQVVGHRDLDPNKSCPCFDVKRWWAGVRKAA